MQTELLQYELDESIACLHFDDGKANALSHAAIDALHAGLDRAEAEARAVLLLGRPGRFSAGFDLKTMTGAGPAGVQKLVRAGAELLLRMYTAPLPIVAGCTGHALAAGALVLLASDARIGAAGDFKIGLNEVAIKMTLPEFALELARERLSKRHFLRATSQAEIYTPAEAVDAGYLDQVVDAAAHPAVARAEAARLAALPQRAFAETKRKLHQAAADHIRATLDADLQTFGG